MATTIMTTGTTVLQTFQQEEQQYHASCTLQKEWERSCAKAMRSGYSVLLQDCGVDDDAGTDAGAGAAALDDMHTSMDTSKNTRNGAVNDDGTSSPVIYILNLMDDDRDDSPADMDVDGTENNTRTTTARMSTRTRIPETAQDHWMDNAKQIAASILLMADMIGKNQRGYVNGDLTDEEASVLESTVLSFAATAANQIDSLRAAIPPRLSSDYSHHCSGIVAILLLRLRETVADPMAVLQKQRTSSVSSIYQHPLACRLATRSQHHDDDGVMDDVTSSVWDQLDGEDDLVPQHQQFLPQREAPAMSTDFISAYASPNQVELVPRPPSLLVFPKQQDTHHRDGDMVSQQRPTKQAKVSPMATKLESERMLYQQQQEYERVQEETQQEFQKEAVLLEASLQNDLDSVYQVEQRMTEITALLSQFSTLVSEQQEDIVIIHDTTVSSKENVSKGQESLIDAKERTKRSKHYMATLVWSVAMILLFFNYVTP